MARSQYKKLTEVKYKGVFLSFDLATLKRIDLIKKKEKMYRATLLKQWISAAMDEHERLND